MWMNRQSRVIRLTTNIMYKRIQSLSLSSSTSPRLVVLGAGAVGLSTAVQLLHKFPRATVTVVADKFNSETTSDGAAGMFRPAVEKTPGVPEELARRWLKDSWQFYEGLLQSVEASEAGCFAISGYLFFDREKDLSILREIVYNVRDLTDKEMSMFGGPSFKHGYHWTSLMSEGRKLLPYLMKKFKELGGHVVKKHISSLEEFVGHCDVLVNCCGFQAKYLLNDDKVYASRGHLIRVEAPWIKHSIYCEDKDGTCTYIFPGCDNVVVGGVRQANDEDLIAREEDEKAIWRRACSLMPSLERAKVLWNWVGLRPMRKPLRLEEENMTFTSGQLKVVHNYGHGGDGISLSWGTATHAVELVQQQLLHAQL